MGQRAAIQLLNGLHHHLAGLVAADACAGQKQSGSEKNLRQDWFQGCAVKMTNAAVL